MDSLICLDEIPFGRTLPQNGPDPRWAFVETISKISKMPTSVRFLIRKASTSASSGDMVGRVDISRDNQSNIEWKIPICSQPIQNAQVCRNDIEWSNEKMVLLGSKIIFFYRKMPLGGQLFNSDWTLNFEFCCQRGNSINYFNY